MTDERELPAVPFLDLVTPHRELREDLLAVVSTALDSGRFIGGPMLEAFEAEFAEFCDVGHCAGVASGTDALRFALLATGIGRGDTVITVPNTFVATVEAILQAGATPELTDIEPTSQNIDAERLRRYFTGCQRDPDSGRPISPRTGGPIAAIVPVHLFGQIADMDPILQLAREYNVRVVEDACQAHGAMYYSTTENRWRKAGSMGDAAAFSFYPGKNLGACGEAGAVTTPNAEIAEKVRMIRDHGQGRKYFHEVEGYNGRLDSIQAGFLSIKLKHLPAWTEQRRSAAARYNELLSPIPGVSVPVSPSSSRAVFHLYVIRVRNRDALQRDLSQNGIGSGLHYPLPIHFQEGYPGLGKKGDFPVAETAADEILSLPMFPGLTPAQIERVAAAIRSHFKDLSEDAA